MACVRKREETTEKREKSTCGERETHKDHMTKYNRTMNLGEDHITKYNRKMYLGVCYD